MSVFTGAGGARAVWFSGLSRRPLRVLLTILGIASGVGLSFAVAAQNASLTSGSAEVYRELAGRSTLELVALGPEGMPLSVAERVRHLPEVAAAAPVSEELITVHHGRRSVDLRLFGVDNSIGSLGGALAKGIPAVKPGGTIGLYLPPSVASDLGAGREAEVEVDSRLGPTPTYVAQVLSPKQTGPIAESSVAVATLSLAELLTGNGSRIQRVLVVPRRHSEGLAHSLQRIGGAGTVVWSTDTEIHAVDQASALDRSSSSLFAALSLVVGGLLAYSAMALTTVERRREVAVLRTLGCGIAALLLAVLLDALLLGAAGTVLGILAGRLALGWLLPSQNSFLSSAFLLDSKAMVPISLLALSCAAGIVTALIAATLPARALVRVAPTEALRLEPSSTPVGGATPAVWLLGFAVTLGGAGIFLTISGYGVLGIPLWVLAGLLAVPATVRAVARTLRRLLPTPGGAAHVGLAEIAGFPARATAAAAIVALSVSGLVIVNGAVSNLETSTAQLTTSSYPSGNLFVTGADREQAFFTQPFAASFGSRLSNLPFVSYARPWRSAFLDWGERRVLAYAFNGETHKVQADEFIEGNPQSSTQTLSTSGGAIALSSDLAAAHGLHIGSHFELPTPSGSRYVHVVAIIVNYGWIPGTITLNPSDFAAWWGDKDVTAYQIGLVPGTNQARAIRRMRAALDGTGLTTVSSAQMRARGSVSARSQLANLQRIGQLIALAGLLAVTAATLAGVLGRMRQVSALRTIGMSLRHVGIAIACEAGCVVAIGALVGAFVGIVGHALVINYLSDKFAMNLTFKLGLAQLAASLALCTAIVLAATAVALRWAARASLNTSLREA